MSKNRGQASSTLSGFALAVEVGDCQRSNGSSIGAYLGLVPSEHSSGQSRRQGSITKSGNSHAPGLTAEEAFARLRELSQGEHTKLVVVSQRLVDEAVRRARARHAGS